MDRKEVWKLHKRGLHPAKIATKLDGKRAEVEQLIKEIAAKKHNRIVIVSIAVLMVIAMAAMASVYFHIKNGQNTTSNKSANQPKPVRIVAEQYLAGRAPDQWLFTSAQVEGTDFPFLISLIDQTTAKLENVLKKYEDIPEVAEQKKMFSGNFLVSFYTGQSGGATLHVSKNKPEDNPFKKNSTEVVLYAKGHQNAPRISHQFAKYDNEWRALIIGGVKFSQQWFDALVIHELEHALTDRAGAASAHSPALSDLWISEELQAHEIERKILDRATKGQYIQRLQQIVNSKPGITKLEALHNSLALEDLRSLDKLFEPATEFEAGIRASQYLLDLGETWLQGKYLGEELKNLKIINYRLVAAI